MKWAAAVVVMLIVLTSCHRRTVYHRYQHTPISGWERYDTLLFEVGPMIRDGVCHEEVELRINSLYPYTKLCLIAEQTVFPADKFRYNSRYDTRCDTLDCTLFDSSGKERGTGISFYQYRFRLADLSLHKGDSIALTIRHNMRRETLPGIADVGLLVEGVPFTFSSGKRIP